MGVAVRILWRAAMRLLEQLGGRPEGLVGELVVELEELGQLGVGHPLAGVPGGEAAPLAAVPGPGLRPGLELL